MQLFSAINSINNRHSGIDLLRGIAVLLVILRHWNVCDYLAHLGWLGVDLFFVLSGFLISGLLFSEYDKYGMIKPTRFFIRRGFKIYPLFYLLIVLTLLVRYLAGYPFNNSHLWAELFFLQNYYSGLYIHTWSLAIEEHFYIILLILFYVIIRYRTLSSINTFYFILFLMGAVLFTRSFLYFKNIQNVFFFTHTRIDSLLAGVAVAYIWRYKKEQIRAFIKRFSSVLLVFCILILSVFGFFEPDNTFTQTIGFTMIYLACSGLLLIALVRDNEHQTKNYLTLLFSTMGIYSYAIYLAHIPVLLLLEYFGIEETTESANLFYFFFYVISCFVTGVIFSELVEQPVLRFRNTHFPSKA